MIVRILTDTNFLDIKVKEEIDYKLLISAIDNMNTLMLETTDDTIVFINPANVVALEVIKIPPIKS